MATLSLSSNDLARSDPGCGGEFDQPMEDFVRRFISDTN
jgi:hypothetical protein